MAAVDTPEPTLPQQTQRAASARGKSKSSPNVIRDPLFWVALVISVCVISAFQWLKTGRWDDITRDRKWGHYVAGLSPVEASVMEWRLILDELKQKHVGNWPDPPIFSELRAKVQLGKFYAHRNRSTEAISTLETAFAMWHKDHSTRSPEDWESWAVLCRLYNQKHEYDKTIKVFDQLAAEYPFLKKSRKQVVEIQQSALEAYQAMGQTANASALQSLIQKSAKLAKDADLWAEDKDTKAAYCDVRYQDYDYALHLLYEGKSRQAADRLDRLVRDDKSWRDQSDYPQSRARLIMMLAVASVAAENWKQAEKVFPIALRLAEQQKFCPCCGNTKPTVYRAYSLFLAHQGKLDDAAKFASMAAAAQAAPMKDLTDPDNDDPDEKNVFDKLDLYAPVLKAQE